MNNPDYKTTFTDTYHDYLAFKPNMFNDRVLYRIKLPVHLQHPSRVRVLGAANKASRIPFKLHGWAVEQDAGQSILHVQVDLKSTGYLQSVWRNKGAAVGIEITP